MSDGLARGFSCVKLLPGPSGPRSADELRQQHCVANAGSGGYLYGGVFAAVDVYHLLGVGVCYDNLRVVHVILYHPLPPLLTLCFAWVCTTCCRCR